MYTEEEDGTRVYTLKVGPGFGILELSCMPTVPSRYSHPLLRIALQKIDGDGKPTHSAHPARFSPDDKFSRERVTCKQRFGLLPTQRPGHTY